MKYKTKKCDWCERRFSFNTENELPDLCNQCVKSNCSSFQELLKKQQELVASSYFKSAYILWIEEKKKEIIR